MVQHLVHGPPTLGVVAHEVVEHLLQQLAVGGVFDVVAGTVEGRGDLIEQLLVAGAEVVAGAERDRRARGEQEPQQAPRCEQVGGGGGLQPLELLRSGILGGAHEAAELGEPVGEPPVHLGDAEVCDPHMRNFVDVDPLPQQHVVGLQIAVDHGSLVGDVEGQQHLPEDAGGDLGGQRAEALDVLAQRAAFLEQGDEVGLLPGALHEAMALHDVVVAELLEDLRFVGEAAKEGAGVAGGIEHLDGDLGTLRLPGTIDLSCQVGQARAAHGENPLDGVVAVEQVARPEEHAPALRGARLAARQVGACGRVFEEGRQAGGAVAGGARAQNCTVSSPSSSQSSKLSSLR